MKGWRNRGREEVPFRDCREEEEMKADRVLGLSLVQSWCSPGPRVGVAKETCWVWVVEETSWAQPENVCYCKRPKIFTCGEIKCVAVGFLFVLPWLVFAPDMTFTKYYRKVLRISYKDHVTNEEVRAKIQQAHEDLLITVKRRKLQWYGHVSRSLGLAKTILQDTVKGGRRQGR